MTTKKVSRYVLKSDLYEFEATVDINIDIFPLKVRKRRAAMSGAARDGRRLV